MADSTPQGFGDVVSASMQSAAGKRPTCSSSLSRQNHELLLLSRPPPRFAKFLTCLCFFIYKTGAPITVLIFLVPCLFLN